MLARAKVAADPLVAADLREQAQRLHLEAIAAKEAAAQAAQEAAKQAASPSTAPQKRAAGHTGSGHAGKRRRQAPNTPALEEVTAEFISSNPLETWPTVWPLIYKPPHVGTHSLRRYICPSCSVEPAMSRDTIWTHVATEHTKKCARCPDCERTFLSPAGIRHHMQKAHHRK